MSKHYVPVNRWNPQTHKFEEELTEVNQDLYAHYFGGDDEKAMVADRGTYHNVVTKDTTVPEKLYFCYGSNLHMPQMMDRCPDTVPVSSFKLQDWRLEFRGVADITERKGSHVDGALWRISHRDEDALDSYEGYPHGYTKRYFDVEIDGETERAMTYVMTRGIVHRPSYGYFQTIAEGYWHWNLDPLSLLEAAQRSGWYESGVKLKDRKVGAKWKGTEHARPIAPREAGEILNDVASESIESSSPDYMVWQAGELGLYTDGWW